MKKVILTLALAVASLAVSAQGLYVSGNIGFGSQGGSVTSLGSTNSSDSKTNFTIAPEIGYYFTENMSVGLEIGYSSLEYGNTFEDVILLSASEKFSLFHASPYFRYHFFSPNDRLTFFGQVGFGIGIGTATKHFAGLKDADVFAFEFGVKPGMAYKMSDKFAITAKLGNIGYNSTSFKLDSDNKYSVSEFSFNVLTDLQLGLVMSF